MTATGARSVYWDDAYRDRGPDRVSWYQTEPTLSLELIEQLGLDPARPIIDVGGGASVLVDRLLGAGHRDVSVLDVSANALQLSQARLGLRAEGVSWVVTDLLSWAPPREYAVWHDRAVFHFLTDPADRQRYRATAAAGVGSGGHVVVATFAEDGPESCSGLPAARYRPDELAEELGAAFEPVFSRREVHHTPFGTEQSFTWLLARRV